MCVDRDMWLSELQLNVKTNGVKYYCGTDPDGQKNRNECYEYVININQHFINLFNMTLWYSG